MNTQIINTNIFKYINHPAISFLLGGFLALSMPGYGISFIAWFGFIPLIYFALEFAKKEGSAKKIALTFFSFGMGFNLVALNWFLHMYPLNWAGFTQIESSLISFIIWVLASLVCSIPFLLWGFVSNFAINSELRDTYKILIIAAAFSLFTNRLLSIGELSFPWAMIEYSQYQSKYLLQNVVYLKGIGLGFYIVLFNVLMAFYIHGFMNKIINLKNFSIRIASVFLSLLIFLGFGVLLYKKPVKTKHESNVSVVQSITPVESYKNEYNSVESFKHIYSEKIKSAPEGIVILPEVAIAGFIKVDDKKFVQQLEDIAKSSNKTIVLGTLDINAKKRPTNSAMGFDKKLGEDKIYDKQKLVPFGEYIPYESFLPTPLKKILKKALTLNYQQGKKITILNTSRGNIAPSICYEIAYSKILRFQSLMGADLLVNLSDLSWFSSNKLKEQFYAIAKFRAVENKKHLISAINTGASFIISPKGDDLLKLEPNKFKVSTVKIKY